MKFPPKTEAELQEENLFPAGLYGAEVVTAEDRVSKSGNDMIALTLKVHNSGRTSTVYDYLLEAMQFKLRHFCRAADLMGFYETGELTSHQCVGKYVQVVLEIEPQAGRYNAKNVVKDYFWESQETKNDASDESLPF